MFSQPCVKNSVHEVGYPSMQWADTPRQTPPGQTQPPNGHRSGQYTSYWNAFLLIIILIIILMASNMAKGKCRSLLNP